MDNEWWAALRAAIERLNFLKRVIAQQDRTIRSLQQQLRDARG